MEFDGLPSMVWPHLLWPWPLTLWPENLISMSQAQLHIWPKLVPVVMKILYSPSSSGYCLVWSWPLPQKLISTSISPNYICDQNLGENPFIGFRDMVFTMFCVIACCDLGLWPLTPKSTQHIYEPKYICDQNWVKFPSLVWDMVFTRFSGRTDSLTHGWTLAEV